MQFCPNESYAVAEAGTRLAFAITAVSCERGPLTGATALLARSFFLRSFSGGLLRCFLLRCFFPGRFFCGFLRRLFCLFLFLCRLFFWGRLLDRSFLCRRLLGRRPALASATTQWSYWRRRSHRFPCWRRGKFVVIYEGGFLFLFLFFVQILFQRFAIGAAVAVLIRLIVPTVESRIFEAHISSCVFVVTQAHSRTGPGNQDNWLPNCPPSTSRRGRH